MEQTTAQGDRRRFQPASDEDWEPFKQAITHLYWAKEGRLREVMETMQAMHNFYATARQYRTRFKKWKLEKNVDSRRMKAIVGIQKRRQENGNKKTKFSFRGRPVPQEKIDRWQRRQRLGDEVLSPHHLAAPTPSGIEYGTPASLNVPPPSAQSALNTSSLGGILGLLSAPSPGGLEFDAMSQSAQDSRPTGGGHAASQLFSTLHQPWQQEVWAESPPPPERSGCSPLPLPSRDLEIDIYMPIPAWDAGARDGSLSTQILLEDESASGMIDHTAQMCKSGLWQAVTNDIESHAHLQGDTSHERMANDDFLHGESDRSDVHDMEADTSSISSSRHYIDNGSFTDIADGRGSAAPRPKATPCSYLPCQSLRVIQMGSTFKSSIKLEPNASASQGNRVMGIMGADIEQRGSDFGGDVEGGENAKLTQGNEIHGQMA